MNSADGTIHFNSSFFAKTLFIYKIKEGLGKCG